MHNRRVDGIGLHHEICLQGLARDIALAFGKRQLGVNVQLVDIGLTQGQQARCAGLVMRLNRFEVFLHDIAANGEIRYQPVLHDELQGQFEKLDHFLIKGQVCPQTGRGMV